MHQTFYIDIDEEITSIVERIRKAQVSEIVMVVPKRALLIQSIVNLKILKKEADEMRLQLMMITQDKLGKVLIEKTGIFVQQKMDNIAEEEINLKEEGRIGEEEYDAKIEAPEGKKSKNRLDKIGSESYFSEEKLKEETEETEEQDNKIKSRVKQQKKDDEEEKIINRELVVGVGEDMGKRQSSMDINSKNKPKGSLRAVEAGHKIITTETQEKPTKQITRKGFFQRSSQNESFADGIGNRSEDKKIEDFFFPPKNIERWQKKAKKDNLEDYNLSSGIHKWFWMFGIISILVIAGIVVYVFLPKATLVITAKIKTKSIDSEIIGDININSSDYEKEVIPAKLILANEELSKKFDSTGNKSVSNQKAKGKVVIYNEYNSNPQPLVATTRFLTEDGKLFRLVKGVTVPGMTKNGEEMKPGTIEVDVMADESGENFNIGPSKFTIPGFKDSGNEKYSKFYAKSIESMTGGGSGSEKTNFVTADDISSAKTKILPELNEKIKETMQDLAGDGAIVFDDSVYNEEAIYKLSNSAGDVADSFQITVQMKASAIVVNERELKDMAAKMISRAGDGQLNIDSNSIILDFGRASADFKNETIDIKFRASGEISPNINVDAIKKDILGKKEDDLTAYLRTFSDIEKAEVNYWPSFINSKIPFRESRVSVVLDKQ